jgi:hypothetical protein
METKHTPGPWEWVGRDLEQKGGEYKTVIGSEVSCGTFCYGGSVDMTVSEADARLIAAAPELLEALILLEHEMVESGNAQSRDYGWKPAIEKTRAAIAKATGE